MMLLLLAAATIGQTSLFGQVVTQHDPSNGYEDYLRAADLTHDLEFGLYRARLSSLQQRDPDEQVTLPYGVKPQDDDLEVKRKMVARYAQALTFIKLGNSKQVYEPRVQYTTQTTFPEYAQFKSLAFLEATAAHLEFANGEPADATTEFIEGFTFADKMTVGPMVSGLVGIACDSVLMAELNRHLWECSAEDAERLERFTDSVIAENKAAEGLNREFSYISNALDGFLQKPSDLIDDTDADTQAMGREIERLSPFERQELKQRLLNLIGQAVQPVVTVLQGPETGWLAAAQPTLPNRGSSLADRLYQAMWDDLFSTNFINAEARQRAKLRLLRLSAKAVEYRWHKGKVPDTLADFTSPDDRIDPLTSQPYKYKREGAWFSITSSGFGEFDTVSLAPATPAAAATPKRDHP